MDKRTVKLGQNQQWTTDRPIQADDPRQLLSKANWENLSDLTLDNFAW